MSSVTTQPRNTRPGTGDGTSTSAVVVPTTNTTSTAGAPITVTASSTTGGTTTATTTTSSTSAGESTATSKAAAAAAAAKATAKAKANADNAAVIAAAQVQQQFNDMVTKCNNSLFFLRRLRHQMKQLHIEATNPERINMGTRSGLERYKKFEKNSQGIKDIFERLEHYARRMPRSVPNADYLDKMENMYYAEIRYEDYHHTVEPNIDGANWNEGQYQFFYYLSELLKLTSHRKRSSSFIRKPLIFGHQEPPLITGHFVFEQAYRGLKKEISHRQLGIYPRTLKCTGTSMIIEFKFGVASPDKTIVIQLKFILVEKQGVIEYINVLAPHEDWKVPNDFGEPHIDSTFHSKYKIYRLLTKQANMHLLNSFGTSNRWTAATLIQFVSLFGKIREVFETRCRLCKKILKNYQPPLCFEIRNPGSAVHDSCR